MTTLNEARAGSGAARGRWPAPPPAKLTVWLLYTLAALVFAVTIVMIARSGTATCTGTVSVRAAEHHAQFPACSPAGRGPVPGRR